MIGAYTAQGVAPEARETLGDRVRQSALLLAGFVVVGVVMAGIAVVAAVHTEAVSPVRTCTRQEPAANMVALGLAGSHERAAAVLETWSCEDPRVDALADASESVRRDTWFLVPAYVAAISYWCLYVHWAAYRPAMRRLAVAAIVGVVIAGALDAFVENTALQHILDGDDASGWAVIAATAALPKFVLLVVGFAVSVVGIGSALRSLLAMVVLGDKAGPHFFGMLDEDEHPLTAPGTAADETARRAMRSLDPHGSPWPPGEIGICLSGGGIRSASFALGAIRALQRAAPGEAKSVWEGARYLSTVSGGGYAGTAAQVLAYQDPFGELPITDDELEKLCESRRFLWGSPREDGRWESTRAFATTTSLFAAGILFNLLLAAACVYVLAHPLGWIIRSTVHAVAGGTTDGRVVANLTAGVSLGIGFAAAALVAMAWSTIRRGWLYGSVGLLFSFVAVPIELAFGAWSWTLVPVVGVAAVALQWTRRKLRDTKAMVLTFGGGVVYGFVGALAWLWIDQGQRVGPGGQVTRLPALALASVVAGIAVAITLGAVARVLHAWRWETGEAKAAWWLGTGVSVLFGIVSASALYLSQRSRLASPEWTDRTVWSVIAVVVVLVYAFGDQKRWSPHPVYKTRLGRSFALTRSGGGPQGPRRPDPLPWQVPTTLSEWAAKPERGPELLISAAVYDTNVLDEHVPAWPFVFSHRYVGGADVGWTRTVDFEAVLGRRNQSDGTLLAAMAISGAAVSPAIGRISLGPVNAAVATLNARLGVWLPSPRSIHRMRVGDGPKPSWLRTRRFTYLFKEIVGNYDIDARLVYVTDGGQVDNLGILELLARGCKTIYCFDASGDLKPGKELTTRTLDQTCALASARLGVTFEGLEALRPMRTTNPAVSWETRVRVACANTATLTIRYPDGATGTLYYAKCLLTGDVPDVVRDYAQTRTGRRRFPADSTIDQWPDAPQFEAYVALGEHTGAKLVAASADAF